jgi:hypothetical protein
MRTLFLTTAAFAALIMVAPIGNAYSMDLATVECAVGNKIFSDTKFTELCAARDEAAQIAEESNRVQAQGHWDSVEQRDRVMAEVDKATKRLKAAEAAINAAESKPTIDPVEADRPRIEAEARAKIAAEQAEIVGAAKAKVRAQVEDDLRAEAEAAAKAEAEAAAKADIEAATKAKDQASADAAKASEARAEAEAVARHDDQVRRDKEAAEAVERARVDGVRRLKEADEAIARGVALRLKSIQAMVEGQSDGALIGWCVSGPGNSTDQINTHDASCQELHRRGIHSAEPDMQGHVLRF